MVRAALINSDESRLTFLQRVNRFATRCPERILIYRRATLRRLTLIGTAAFRGPPIKALRNAGYRTKKNGKHASVFLPGREEELHSVTRNCRSTQICHSVFKDLTLLA
jgi:hypothetical protein